MKDRLEQINTGRALKAGLLEGEEVSYNKVREAIRNPETFAKKIEPSSVEISPGVLLKSKTIELADGNFSNMYDLSFSNKDGGLSTKIITRKAPIYSHKFFANEHAQQEKPVACINGSFFLLVDEQLEQQPDEIIFNLNIRDGKVHGLPAVDRAAMFATKDGKIHATELKARGTVQVGEKEITWQGGEAIAHKKPGSTEIAVGDGRAILFNSACCTIEYENGKDKTSLRKLRKDLNKTPSVTGVSDIVVRVNDKEELYVAAIHQGGGTDFFDGSFILQMKDDDMEGIKVNDKVDPKTIDGLNINDIQSAMTTGPMVSHFLEHDDHEMNHDYSVGNFPPFIANARYARSVMYEDEDSNIHMVVFDAVPRSEKMKGLTPKEVAQNIPVNTKWAVFLDGGQSSRITFEPAESTKDDTKTDARGNRQYVRLHKSDKKSQMLGSADERFLWTNRGRPISSMIVVYRQK